ncbi:hypothetical protein CHU98_g991 [Xylaria longipes]|nr:hypothetical protein CHU98_g991 [Xylaria longipes]
MGAAQFVHNEWIESYDPTIEDSYRTQMTVDVSAPQSYPIGFHKLISLLQQRQVVLEILDTAGTDQFVAMRDLYMKTGQGFLLVFSITSAASLNEIAGLRDEIIRIKDDENVPIVICGNKADLEEYRAIPRARGFEVSQRWGAPYYETSARNKTNVDEVFVDLCRQMLRKDDAGGDMSGHRNDDWSRRCLCHRDEDGAERRVGKKNPDRPTPCGHRADATSIAQQRSRAFAKPMRT